MQNHQLANSLIVSWHLAPLTGDSLWAAEDTSFAVVTQGASILAMEDTSIGSIWVAGTDINPKNQMDEWNELRSQD